MQPGTRDGCWDEGGAIPGAPRMYYKQVVKGASMIAWEPLIDEWHTRHIAMGRASGVVARRLPLAILQPAR